jgi:hypothetical protein
VPEPSRKERLRTCQYCSVDDPLRQFVDSRHILSRRRRVLGCVRSTQSPTLDLGRRQENGYAAFLCAALTFAHRARCAAAIFLRADADMVRFTGAEAAAAGFDPFPALAHLAFCALAIFRREAAEIIRVGWFPFRDVPKPFNDSITEIAWPNFSTCNCASRCSARSC